MGCCGMLWQGIRRTWSNCGGRFKRSSFSLSWKCLFFIPKMSFFLNPISVSTFKYHSVINYIIKVLSHIPLAHQALCNFPWFCNASFFSAFNRVIVLTWARTTHPHGQFRNLWSCFCGFHNDLEGAPGINEWGPGVLGILPGGGHPARGKPTPHPSWLPRVPLVIHVCSLLIIISCFTCKHKVFHMLFR